MTRITACISKEFCNLTAEGHATSKQEVCTAISAILWALAGWIKSAEKDEGSNVVVKECSMHPGHTVFNCTGDERLIAAFEVATIGLGQIAKKYPKECIFKHIEI